MEYTGSSVADFEVIFEAGWSAEITVHCFELLLEYTGSSVADFEVIFEAGWSAEVVVHCVELLLEYIHSSLVLQDSSEYSHSSHQHQQD